MLTELVENTDFSFDTQPHREPSSTSDEVVDTLIGALESAISSLKKAALARRAVARVHRIQAGVALSDIAEHVADAFHVRSELLISRRRSQHIAYSRAVAIFLCRKLTKNSFPDIGEFFDRDHSTVIFAYQKIERRVQQDPAFRQFIAKLEVQIGGLSIRHESRAEPDNRLRPSGAGDPLLGHQEIALAERRAVAA